MGFSNPFLFYRSVSSADVNDDGTEEWVYTNSKSGRWAILEANPEGIPSWSDYGDEGGTRIIGIYEDPLVLEGIVESGSPHDSQERFSKDLLEDNLVMGSSADVDGDGFGECFWKTSDGTAFLRTVHHDDGNIKYANYMNSDQFFNYVDGWYGDQIIWSLQF